MNRLWVRLSVAFGMVVLLGVTTIISAYLLLARFDVVETPLRGWMQAPGGMVEQLTKYYQAHNGWQGVDTFLAGAESSSPESHLAFSLHDAASPSVYTTHAEISDKPLDSVPITVDGQVRGTLDILRAAPMPSPNQQRFLLARLRDFLLLVAGVGGVVGILFGVLSSRHLTAPLEQLAAAAQAIGARELHRRVEVKGSREVAAVARAFNNMAAALEQAEVLRRNLVADVAHELRTPLSVLQGNLLAILDGVYPLETSEIARLHNQTHLLSRLVNDLHELSLAESRQLRLHKQETDIKQLLSGVVAAFSPTADAAEIHLDLQVARDLPHAMLDPMRLTQVLDNLLGNALRHTPMGGTISLRAAAHDGYLELNVKDTGEGITADHLPHVFDRFYRTDRARSRATGGTGLGLAIVRAIVEMHGGSVAASSDGIPGHGTTFTVKLPISTPTTGEPTPPAAEKAPEKQKAANTSSVAGVQPGR